MSVQLDNLSDIELLGMLEKLRSIDSLPYLASPKQLEFHLHPARGADKVVLYGGAIGGGKLLDINTKLVYRDGFRTMGDVKIDDEILGPDGNFHKVTFVSTPQYETAYLLTFDDGSTIVAHDEHLWKTFTLSERVQLTRRTEKFREKRKATRSSKVKGNKSIKFTETISLNNQNRQYTYLDKPEGTIRTTKEIVDTLRVGKNQQVNHAIQVTKPIQLPKQELPIDPYVLGVWLGDGTSCEGSITSMDPDIIEIVVKAGYEISSIYEKKDNKAKTYRFKNLYRDLKKLGVLNNKHIPQQYLWSSYEQRLALLQGLLDTDGTVAKSSYSAEFCNTNKNIVDGCAHLIRSLGHKIRVREKKMKSDKHKTAWMIKFSAKMPVFRLERKLSLLKLAERTTSDFHYIIDAQRIEKHWMRCISIDSEDHLYAVGDSFIATHNTFALCAEAIRECLEVQNNRVLLARKTLVDFRKSTLITLLRLMPDNVTHRKAEFKFIFPNGSELLYTGIGEASDIQKLRGLEIGFLGIDEVSEIGKDNFLTAMSRCRWHEAQKANRIKIRCASNPDPGWLKEDFIDHPKKGRVIDENGEFVTDENGKFIYEQKYFYIPATLKDNPHVGPTYAAEAEETFADSPNWKQAFLEGDWNAFSGDDQIIPSHIVSDAMKVHNQRPGMPVRWGLDVSRKGNDTTQLWECAGLKIRKIHQWRKKGADIILRDLKTFYRDAAVKPEIINVDEVGVGGGLVDVARADGLPVKGIDVTHVSKKGKKKFANVKAELWWNFRNFMFKNKVDLENDHELSAELGATRYGYRSNRIYVEEKDEVRKRLGRSPDKADAVVLAVWPGAGSFVLYDDELPKEEEKEEQYEVADDARTKIGLLKLYQRGL